MQGTDGRLQFICIILFNFFHITRRKFILALIGIANNLYLFLIILMASPTIKVIDVSCFYSLIHTLSFILYAGSLIIIILFIRINIPALSLFEYVILLLNYCFFTIYE